MDCITMLYYILRTYIYRPESWSKKTVNWLNAFTTGPLWTISQLPSEKETSLILESNMFHFKV